MKKFYVILLSVIVAMTAVNVSAKTFPGKKAPKKAKTENLMIVKEKKPVINQELVAAPTIDKFQVKDAPVVTNRNPKLTDIITEVPDGEKRLYSRSGDKYYRSSGSVVTGTQDSYIEIVFCDNNEVYLLEPVSGVTTGNNVYVKGTLEDNVITVELPQTVYLTQYGYNLELAWVDVVNVSTSDVADRATTTATYTIDGNTITLEGSDANHVLGYVWDDDDTWYGAGDYNTVYSLATDIPEAITPPAGSTPATYYYSGKNYDGDSQSNFSTTVQIVRDGDDVYFQGLSQDILPESWAMGTLADGIVTIPMGQYIGLNSGNMMYLVGYDENAEVVSDILFAYDENEDTYTLQNPLFINGKPDAIYYYFYTLAGAVIGSEEPEVPTVVEVPETATVESDWSIDASGSKTIQINGEANVAFDGNDVYFQGLAYYFPDAWIKGTISNGVASFPSGQLLGEDSYGPEYFTSMDGQPITFSYDDVNKVFTMTSSYYFETADQTWASNNYYVYIQSAKVFKGEIVVPDPVVAPDDLETTTYTWIGYDVTFEDTDDDDSTEDEAVYTEFTRFVEIGFDGTDVYVQGLCDAFPEAWVKGTLDDNNVVTFETGQFFGIDDSWVDYGYPADYYYFVGYGENGISDVTFTYDAENNHFVGNEWILINGKADEINYYSINAENEWLLFNEVPGKPVAPEIKSVNMTGSYPKANLNITLETTNGDAMNPAKVFYRFFTDVDGDIQPLAFAQEDYSGCEFADDVIYEIPYTMDDGWDIYEGGDPIYFNQDKDFLTSVCRLGVQVVYYGGMENQPAPLMDRTVLDVAENESEVVWFKIKNYTGIETVTGAKTVESVRYINAAGLSSDKPFDGLNIVVKKMSDGSTVVTKVLK